MTEGRHYDAECAEVLNEKHGGKATAKANGRLCRHRGVANKVIDSNSPESKSCYHLVIVVSLCWCMLRWAYGSDQLPDQRHRHHFRCVVMIHHCGQSELPVAIWLK